jgi:alkylation response protein AidB-like acyl-CoA dehydrogenase
VNLTPTPEQDELRSVVRDFLQSVASEPAVRAAMDTDSGYDPAVWAQLSRELELTGLTIPEQYGGAGAGMPELLVVLEEMGRVLLPSPFFATIAMAATAILESGDEEAMTAWLPGIARGETLATLAVAEADGRWDDPAAVAAEAAERDGGWRVDGEKRFVLDGAVADLLLVAARTPEGVGLVAVRSDQPGVQVTALPSLDPTRRLATVVLRDAEATLVGGTDGWAVIARALDRAAIALAAEQLGGATRCLELAVDYSRIREQFNRPIGSFEAIKHKAADVLVENESARAAVRYAAWCSAEQPDELVRVAPLAKAFCSDAFVLAASQDIQIHGGIGFTWDHPAHLYFRRAHWSALFLGDARHHRAQLADRLGIGSAQ